MFVVGIVPFPPHKQELTKEKEQITEYLIDGLILHMKVLQYAFPGAAGNAYVEAVYKFCLRTWLIPTQEALRLLLP